MCPLSVTRQKNPVSTGSFFPTCSFPCLPSLTLASPQTFRELEVGSFSDSPILWSSHKMTWFLGRLVTSVHGMNRPSGPSSLLLFWVCGWDSFPVPYSCMALTIALRVMPVTFTRSFQSLTAVSVCPRVIMIHPTSRTSSTKAGADPEQETSFNCSSWVRLRSVPQSQ